MLKFTVTWMPLRHLWPRERERERESWRRNSAGWQEIFPELSHRFRISGDFTDYLFPFYSFLEQNEECLCTVHMCAFVCVCVCLCLCVCDPEAALCNQSLHHREDVC